MNYVVLYLNAAGFPAFMLMCEDCISDVKREFKVLHPNCKIQKIYISVEDMRTFLTASLC